MQLEITNIRVMQKIDGYARRLMELLKDVDQDVAKKVIRSLVVIAWSIITPKGEGVPDLEFISKNRYLRLFAKGQRPETAEEAEWNSILTRYGFMNFDEFDQILATDVINGFFNDENILSGANKYLKDVQNARAQAALEAAWKPFHGSFDNNAEEVATALFDGCVEHIMYLSPSNLSAAVGILKDIGCSDLGQKLLIKFIESKNDDYTFDLLNDPFGSLITDPDVIKEFNKKAAQGKKALPTPMEAASMIYKDHFSPEGEETLAKLSVDDFVALFKEAKGDDQSVLVNGSIGFRRVSNATERQKRITETAQAALVKIGKESALNARRIKKYGIVVDPPQSLA